MRTVITSVLVVLGILQVGAATATPVSYSTTTSSNPCTACSVSDVSGVVTVGLGTGTYSITGATGPVVFGGTGFATNTLSTTPFTETFTLSGNTIEIFYNGANTVQDIGGTILMKLTGYFTVNGAGAFAIADTFGGNNSGISFSQNGFGSLAPTTPIPGGLVLFGSALVGASLLLRRRKLETGAVSA